MADWEVGMHSGCTIRMARPNLHKYGLYKACILSESALSIGVENHANEDRTTIGGIL